MVAPICPPIEPSLSSVKPDRLKAEAFKVAIYNTILYYIKQGINSERCTMKNLLTQQGHEDLAKILTEIK